MESTIERERASAAAAEGSESGSSAESASLAEREAAGSRATFADLGLAPELLEAVRVAG